MLSHYDDYPFHQTADPFLVPYVDDKRWFDRFWFMTGNADAGLCLITGMGTYPNAELMDGYAMLSDGKRQWNLRAGRHWGDDRTTLAAEGLGFELREPMKEWGLSAEGFEEFGFDLSFHERHAPNNLPKLHVEKDGEVRLEMGHFAQAGEMRGKIRLGEREVAVDGWSSERDRSWGRRGAAGKVKSGLHVWLPAQVGERMIWVWFRERGNGERLGMEGYIGNRGEAPKKVTDVSHKIDVFEEIPGHRQLREAEVTVTLEDGERVEIHVEPIIPVFIAGGGYVEGSMAQGTYVGKEVTSWTVDDDGRREIPNCIIDHFSRITVDGQVGQGVFELSVGRYEPLGFDFVQE